MFDAYLDIETMGLSRFYHEITVVGTYLVDGRGSRLIQFVGDAVTKDNILQDYHCPHLSPLCKGG